MLILEKLHKRGVKFFENINSYSHIYLVGL